MLKRNVAPRSMAIGSARSVVATGIYDLRHHSDEDWAPGRKHDISDSIRHRVTQRRQFTLCLFLNGAKCSRDRSCAGTRAQHNDWIHLQDITAEQDCHGVWEDCDDKTDEDETDPGFLQS